MLPQRQSQRFPSSLAAGLTSLQDLSLESCYQITVAGLERLSGLTQLKCLNLGSCGKISGFRHLTGESSRHLHDSIPLIHPCPSHKIGRCLTDPPLCGGICLHRPSAAGEASGWLVQWSER